MNASLKTSKKKKKTQPPAGRKRSPDLELSPTQGENFTLNRFIIRASLLLGGRGGALSVTESDSCVCLLKKLLKISLE